MTEKFTTLLNVRSNIAHKGNKPYKLKVWCAKCGEELFNFASFNYYECCYHITQHCGKLNNCPKCNAKLVLEETFTTVA